MKTKIKAVVFDMDGVLIDAREWHYDALNKALKLFGAEISKQDHLSNYDGLPTLKKLKMLSDQGKIPVGLHNFINELKQEYTLQMVYTNCKPSFQHQYALAKLSKMGYKLAVCSNSVRNTIQVMMEKSDLLKYLEFYLSNQDVVLSKPNPEIYINAIHKLSIKPSECLVIEDNKNGIEAAHSAGAFVLEVASPNEVSLQRILDKIFEIENA